MNMENKNDVVTKSIEDELKELEKMYEKNRGIILQLVSEGNLPEPRKLTRTERKSLDAAEVNIFKIRQDDNRGAFEVKEKMADWILDNIYPNFNFDALDNNICLWFGEYIFGLSYNKDLSIKN